MDVFKFTLYLLAAATSLGCTVLLLRAFTRTGMRILMWSGICFVCLTVNNVLLFIDLALLPTEIDLRVMRQGAALTGMLFMIYGFIQESE